MNIFFPFILIFLCIIWFFFEARYFYKWNTQEIVFIQSIPLVEEILIPKKFTEFTNETKKEYISLFDILKNPNTKNIWGEENIHFLSQNEIQVDFKKWSFSPQNSQEIGWAGFLYYEEKLSTKKHFALEYTLEFEEGFDFVKWWKLPWICAGLCPRWWENSEDGFSTRMMWRQNGELEIYGYFPWNTGFGKNIWRGMYRFQSWKSYTIAQEIILNNDTIADGSIRIYVDNVLVYQEDNILFLKTRWDTPLFLIFSTFFWGSDTSWASSKDTFIRFKDFAFYIQ